MAIAIFCGLYEKGEDMEQTAFWENWRDMSRRQQLRSELFAVVYEKYFMPAANAAKL
jgi:hypothetical protein